MPAESKMFQVDHSRGNKPVPWSDWNRISNSNTINYDSIWNFNRTELILLFVTQHYQAIFKVLPEEETIN
jgi:hypothetical protein